MGSIAFCLSLAVLPVLVQAPRSPASPVERTKVDWDGEWTLQSSGSEPLPTQVEAHLKDENFALRLYWKRKILAACTEFTKIDILSGDGLSITLGKERPIDTPGDGSEVEWKRSDDTMFKATFRREGPTLIQTLQSEGTTLTFVYSMRKDGESLALQVTYAHPKLSNPFTFKRIFRRSA